jgi:GTP pyrophosphokinase
MTALNHCQEETDYNAWLNKICASHPTLDNNLIKKAFDYGLDHNHPLAQLDCDALSFGIHMAEELIALQADPLLIYAALAYPSAASYNYSQLCKQLPCTLAKLITGAHAIEQIEISSESANASQTNQADKLRKMVLAMVDDVRVVVLKLVERLVTLRHLKTSNLDQQHAAAKIVRKIYAPLANRLGIGQLKWQLEDWAFRYDNPDEYQNIKKKLNMRRQDREDYVASVIETISGLLQAAQVNQFEISGRAKHIYSIHRKIVRKQVDFDEIYDAIAVRVLVHSIQDCYTALSTVHTHFEHIAKEFDDYVANPKPNGYRSIHTAVVGPEKRNVEIQIRTHAMHEEAELGVAAHWAYKEGGSNKVTQDHKVNWLRQVLAWQQEVSEPEQLPQDNSPLFADRVYVFTPQGDIIDLPEGATPLDFAYHVHSDIGHRCRGASVNGALVPLTYTLKNGDKVNIQTAKEPKPSRDWISADSGYLKTARARSKVAHWFRAQNFQYNLEKGQEVWDKASKNKGISKQAITPAIYQHFNFKQADALLAALGSGDISIQSVIAYIGEQNRGPATHAAGHSEAELETEKTFSSKTREPSGQSPVCIAGVDNLLSQLAKCCKPIPGDPIIGYITQGRGVTIHRQDCHNIIQAQHKNPGRIINTSWGDKISYHYPVDLILEAHEKHGLIRDITHLIASEKLLLMSIRSSLNSKRNRVIVSLTIELNSIESMQRVIQLLQQMPEVISVTRKNQH